MAIGSSHCKYVDLIAFEQIMGEKIDDPSYYYYPVVIKALRIDWILKCKYGHMFLKSILTMEDLDHYKIESC